MVFYGTRVKRDLGLLLGVKMDWLMKEGCTTNKSFWCRECVTLKRSVNRKVPLKCTSGRVNWINVWDRVGGGHDNEDAKEEDDVDC